METEIILTDDGSCTFRNEYFGETYHSINGAVSESIHIFINLGLKCFCNTDVKILEIGYGTGLNAVLSYLENQQQNNRIFYHGIEKFPVNPDNFNAFISKTPQIAAKLDDKLLQSFCFKWNEPVMVSSDFTLLKQNIDFNEFQPQQKYDIIYFDAFSPDTQPEMWSETNLKKIINSLAPDGIFVTYCSKGIVKQTLRNLGLVVKRMPGPKGKRHVIQAKKLSTSI